jgi:hypothetical protein
MRSFRYTQHIDRPRDDVFDFMMDFAQASRWRNMVRRVELVGGGPLRQGAEMLVTFDVMGRTKQLVSELWAYDPPRRFGQRNTAAGFTGTFEYTLEPEASGTRVTFTCDIRPHGWRWIVLPLAIRSNRRRYREQLASLKRAIEGPPPAAP